jgi:hypothetical protein
VVKVQRAAHIWRLGGRAHCEGLLLGHGGLAGGLKVNTGVEEASDWGYPHPVAKETLTVTLGEGIIPRTNNSERRACLSFPTSTNLLSSLI